MLNSELTALIPDEAYRELPDVVATPITRRRLWFLKTALGYQGEGRRVWLIDRSGGDAFAVIDVSLARVHSHSEAEQLGNGIRPTLAVISALAEFDLTLKDTSDGIRSATWHSGGLNFNWLVKQIGSFCLETITAGNAPGVVAAEGHRVFDKVAKHIAEIPESRKPSWGRFAGAIWSLVYQIPWVVLFVFGGYFVGSLFGPRWLALTVMLFGTMLYMLWIPSRSASNRHKGLLATWTRICRDGGLDGNMRRALTTIGYSLPDSVPEPRAAHH